MRRAAAAAYPEERCGLLVGQMASDGALHVSRAVATANVAAGDRARRFEVDPAARFRLMRDLRESEVAMVGHYHSHPDHPAVPSAYDLSMVFEPDLVWLIVAVAQGCAGEIAAFRPKADGSGFTPLSLRIGEVSAGNNSG